MSLNFFFQKICLRIMYSVQPACMPSDQKRAPEIITVGGELPCGFRELNPEQAVLLTTGSSLRFMYLNVKNIKCDAV